jgi:hypothetical protein
VWFSNLKFPKRGCHADLRNFKFTTLVQLPRTVPIAAMIKHRFGLGIIGRVRLIGALCCYSLSL